MKESTAALNAFVVQLQEEIKQLKTNPAHRYTVDGNIFCHVCGITNRLHCPCLEGNTMDLATLRLDIFLEELEKASTRSRDPRLQEALIVAIANTRKRFAEEQDPYTAKG